MSVLSDERGVSIVAVILMMLLISVMGQVLVSMVITENRSAPKQMQVTQAQFIAETGIDRALRYLLKREDGTCTICTCASINGHAAMTNIPSGAGTFTVTTALDAPAIPTTITGGLNNTDITSNIPVLALGGYGPYGRIMIDREMIDCQNLSVNPFSNCRRGIDLTQTSTHAGPAVATRVAQNQCRITSAGTVPSETLPAERVITAAVSLQAGWAVGDDGGGAGPCPNNNGRIVHWNGSNWTCQNSPANQNLRGVSMLSYADGFAVGEDGGGGPGACPSPNNARIARWDGVAWNLQCSPSNQILNSVSMISSQDGFAVGDEGNGGGGACTNNRARIVQWNGATWNCLASPANQNLNGVSMLDTDNDGIAEDGFAVGDNGGGGGNPCPNNNGRIIRWNVPVPGAWTCLLSPSNQDLNGVDMVSINDGFAVGDRGGGGGGACTNGRARLLRWNGAAWNCVASPATFFFTRNLNAVSMLDTDGDGFAEDGWAIGDRLFNATFGWYFVRWDGAAWNWIFTNTPGINADNLRGIHMLSPTDGWAVGDNGVILHWDGLNWNVDPQSQNVNENLRSVYVVSPNKPVTDWRENF